MGLLGFHVLKTASARSSLAQALASATQAALGSASPMRTSKETMVPMTA